MKNPRTKVSTTPTAQEDLILQALANVHKLILYKLGSGYRDSVEDLKQRIFYKIWLWRHRGNKELELKEWQKMINKTVNSEVSEYFSEKWHLEILFSQVGVRFSEKLFEIESVDSRLEGNSEAENHSLLRLIWKAAQTLSLRQRYAFLLYNPNFLIEFLTYKCCSAAEVADLFEMTETEITALLKLLPLSDEKISIILETKINEKISPNRLRDSRAKAKTKLGKILKDYSIIGLMKALFVISCLYPVCDNFDINDLFNLLS